MLSKQDYFKGWYFKCSTQDKTIAFIPAYHISGGRRTASLQIITNGESYNLNFGDLRYRKNPLFILIGNCSFSLNGIRLNIRSGKINIFGTLRFHMPRPVRYNIMGPFKYIPFMQCKHDVYSMKHRIDGELTVNGQHMIFQNGNGYIEGDSGTSFPNRYIWTQCAFPNGSLMLSVADIPLFGFTFTGIIGVVAAGKKEYRIATYLGAKVKHISKNTVVVKQGNYQLTARLIEKNAHPLYAPCGGKMDRTIHESASCKAYYHFAYKEKTICRFISNTASFEFEYK